LSMLRWASVVPRPEQREAVERWLAAGGRGSVVMPTGVGKSVVAIEALRRLGVPRTLVVAPTVRLLKEWRQRLAYSLNTPVGAYYGEAKYIWDVTVTTYSSATLAPFIFSFFDFVVFDEVHHVAAKKFSVCLEKTRKHRYVLGLTATLQRLDDGHGLILQHLPLVYRMELATAKLLGRVAPLEVVGVGVHMTPEEGRQYDALTQAIRRAMHVGDRDKAQKLVQKRKALLSSVAGKAAKLVELARQHAGERVLVFSESVDSVEGFKETLEAAGIPSATYHSNKRAALREYVMDAWGRDFDVLLSVRALEEGVDVPEVSVGIVVASGKANRQLVQRMGRILRPKPDGRKAVIYVVYCYNTYEWDVYRRIRGLYEGSVRYF
jgi:superfamily II DNA or RNA helicase